MSTGQSQSVAIVLLEAYKQKGQHGFLTFARGLLEGNTTAPAIAKKAGVDWARVEKAIADHRWREALVSERDAAKRLGITRPTALLGTRRLRHVWAYPLQEALEDALENGP